MKYIHYKLTRFNSCLHAVASCAAKFAFIIAATAYSTTVAANAMNTCEKTNIKTDTDTCTSAYVDSVLQWGAWELDIEPAAGGLQPATTRPLNTSESSVTLRTNSISALAPPRRVGANPVPEIPIVTPVVPVTTPPVIIKPIVVPISTNVPVPTGAP